MCQKNDKKKLDKDLENAVCGISRELDILYLDVKRHLNGMKKAADKIEQLLSDTKG